MDRVHNERMNLQIRLTVTDTGINSGTKNTRKNSGTRLLTSTQDRKLYLDVSRFGDQRALFRKGISASTRYPANISFGVPCGYLVN